MLMLKLIKNYPLTAPSTASLIQLTPSSIHSQSILQALQPQRNHK